MTNNSKLLVIFAFLFAVLGTCLVLISRSPNPFGQLLGETTNSVNTISAPIEEKGLVLVTKVVDGDTIKIEGGETVRLLGVDTPETVDPRRPVGCFGKEASSEMKRLLEGKKVFLEKDVSETDKYKRLLRYVYLPLENGDKLFVNDYLVREGYAKVLTYPPDVEFAEKFLEAQKEARLAKRGLWGKC